MELGEVMATIKCDSRDLEVALARLDRLIEKAQLAQSLGIQLSPVSTSVGVVAAAVIVSSPQPLSRRQLFGFWRR